MITVTDLRIAPVKALRLLTVARAEVTSRGVTGDRAFAVVDEAGALLLSTRTPELLGVEAAYQGDTAQLTLRFPDGSTVQEGVEAGPAAITQNYDGRKLSGRLAHSNHGRALSSYLGRPVRLLIFDHDVTGGDDAPISLMSRASLAAVSSELGADGLDARRFRMTICIDGVEAWAEHSWTDRTIMVGDTVELSIGRPIPRCVVTTRHPETGKRDMPTLRALATLRGKRDVNFGVWCTVKAPGTIGVGDRITGPGLQTYRDWF